MCSQMTVHIFSEIEVALLSVVGTSAVLPRNTYHGLTVAIVPLALEQLWMMLPGCTIVKGSVNQPNTYLKAYHIRSFGSIKHPICLGLDY